jgi:glycerol-3-phosphate O-acyltransferase 1/2
LQTVSSKFPLLYLLLFLFLLQEIQLDPLARRRDVKNMLQVTQHAGRQPNSTNLDWGVWFYHLAQCIRLQKFLYPQVAGTVLSDERVTNAIDQVTKESMQEKASTSDDTSFDEDSYYDEMRRKHEQRAKRLLIEMRSKISQTMLRITSWVLYKLLPLFLTGAVTHPAQVEMLKSATEKMPGVPLIFLPLHRSHLDYILVSYILVNNDIRSPLVAGGINLNIPIFG